MTSGASGKRTSVSTAAIGGVLDPAAKKLADSMDKASQATDKASQAEGRKLTEDEKEMLQTSERRRDATYAAVSGVAQGAIQALGRPGAGAADAAFGAASGLASALPALGATLGSGAGPLGTLIGGGLGALGSAALQRTVIEEGRQHEAAISDTIDELSPLARAGFQIDPQTISDRLEVSQTRVARAANLSRDVRASPRAQTMWGMR